MAVPVADGHVGSVRFGLLGPLQVVDGSGAAQVVPAAKQRIVLAALLLAGGSTVSAPSLAEALWDASPPPNAPSVMRTYVIRLRRALGPVGARVIGGPPGWAVDLRAAGEFDLAEVELLWRTSQEAAEAEQWRQASLLLGQALSLWRGEPLADVPSAALARREAERLAELRLQLTEAHVGADLSLGRHSELVAELRRLVAEHPLREHLRAQLMLACYRCGQQAAALEVYRDAHRTLAEELGVEPGDELRQMHQRILAADPLLTAAAQATISRPGGEEGQQVQPEAVVPRQLPGGVQNFTGRAAELESLSGLAGQDGADDSGVIVVISGMAGVGKTALTVHWARQAAPKFPDGQLYVNLRGFGPSGTPVAAAEAIRGFLDLLGVAANHVPVSFDAQVGLYRSLVVGKRLLIVLDNARDVDQVRPLLPGSPGCLVVVTSRARLAGLAVSEGAHLITLDVLPEDKAGELLALRLGAERAAAEPGAVSDLIALCGRLPLALAIAAARAAGKPEFPLAELAADLRAQGRLDGLDAGDAASTIRTVFAWSYECLQPPAARMFRLLGLHPGPPDITVPAAASLAGIPVSEARQTLRELSAAHLLIEHSPGRFTFHDLLRAYAIEQADTIDTEADREQATGRVLDHYLHTAHAAALLLNPSREPLTLIAARPGVTPGHLADHQQALAWFEAEHRVLIAAVGLASDAGFDACAWQLPWAMANFLDWHGHWQEWAATQRTALAAATRLGDRTGQALAPRALASACARLGDYDQALIHLAESLGIYRQSGDRAGQARVLQTLSWLSGEQDRPADALGYAQQALALFRAVGDRTGQASALNNAGWYHILLGNPRQARSCCRQALARYRELGDRHGQASSWDSLGYAEHHLSNLSQAAECYDRALVIYRELGNRYYQADTLTHLGDTRHAAGQPQAARDAWLQALSILEDLHHPEAADVRARLAQPSLSTKKYPGAITALSLRSKAGLPRPAADRASLMNRKASIRLMEARPSFRG
jgi:DNA-binding SARP family transcriptional activator/tetratricopeptide (TPR) repeat protein